MRKWLAGWFGCLSAWWARQADRTYPNYSERMRREHGRRATGHPDPPRIMLRGSDGSYWVLRGAPDGSPDGVPLDE